MMCLFNVTITYSEVEVPAITPGRNQLRFIKEPRNLHLFLKEAKNINSSKGYLEKEDFENLCVRYGIAEGPAFSILSFYKLINFENPVNYACKGCVCERLKPDKEGFEEINCLGQCDNPPAYFFTDNNKNSISAVKTKILSPGKNLLNSLKLSVYFNLINEILKLPKEIIIENIKKSNLKGRGGAGFPAFKKIESVMSIDDNEKFVVCNADESAPFVFKDRALIEHNSFSPIFGLIVSAYLIDAKDIYIYIRGEYKLQKEIFENTLNIILNANKSDFIDNLNFHVFQGGGAYVCGEETALFESIEGKRGEPRKKPPFPFEKGLFQKPTLISNIETFARIFHIASGDIDFGEKKLYCISGDVNKSGVFEESCKISVKDAVEKYAEKLSGKFGFALLGSASGIFQKDYSELIEIPGTGSLFISNENGSIDEVLEYILKFLAEESCGKCLTCKNGYMTLLNMLKNNKFQKAKVLSIVDSMFLTNLCGLGKALKNPVETYFQVKEGV